MYPIELVSPTFNCTYECFSKTKAMRQASEVMAVPHSTLKNKYTDLSVVLVGPIQFAAYAALVSYARAACLFSALFNQDHSHGAPWSTVLREYARG